MLNNLIKAMENSQELRFAWEDFTDAVVVESLKKLTLEQSMVVSVVILKTLLRT